MTAASPARPARLSVRALARPGLGPIDLELAPGECLAVSGPSGSGKTLLLRALADMDPATGEITLDGTARETMPAPAWRRRVGWLQATPGWWADRVGDHFAHTEAVAPLLTALDLPAEATDWPVDRLSTGEAQRLALVRLLEGAPDVLLLDEPTSGLDPDATALVETLLQDRMNSGVAILLVTHDAAQAGRLANHRLRLRAGLPENSGTP